MDEQNEKTNGKQEDEEEQGFTEVLDFTKPNFEFIPKGSHEYTQRGPYLLCRSCELEHAVWIGMDQIMVGVSEDGQPILKNRG